MRIYNYGGVISKNLLITDLADIKFLEFVKSFDNSEFTNEEKLKISLITEKLLTDDVSFALAANDPRILYVFNKLMVKYPNAKKFYGLNEWVILYHFLKDFYDKSLPQIDSVIRFINLYIGKMYGEEDVLQAGEVKEIISSYNEVYSSIKSEAYENIIPKFVFEELNELKLEPVYLQKYDSLFIEESFDSLLKSLAE
jgi:hypothetical protein